MGCASLRVPDQAATFGGISFGAQPGVEGQHFNGESLAHLDGKGRVGIPADWRPLLRGDERAVFFAYPSLKQNADDLDYLRCISAERFNKLIAQVAGMPTYHRNRQLIEGLVISKAKAHNLDTQGRAVLNADLLREVGIGEDMKILGSGDHFQIWDPKALQQHRDRLAKALLAGDHDGIEDLHI